MESPPIPPTSYTTTATTTPTTTPFYHLLLPGLISLRACTTRRPGATSGFSSPPRPPGVFPSPSCSPTTTHRIYSPSLLTPLLSVLRFLALLASGDILLRVPATFRKSRATDPALHLRRHPRMPFTIKLTHTCLALALLALSHGHPTGTDQRASPPAPQPHFLTIEHLTPLLPTRRHLYEEPSCYTTSPLPTPPSSLRPAHTPPTRSTWWYTCRPYILKTPPLPACYHR